MSIQLQRVKFDLLASVTGRVPIDREAHVDPTPRVAKVGDLVAVRDLNEIHSCMMIDTYSGWLALIKKYSVFFVVLGEL